MYKRVLIKISGEQLSGRHEVGIDPEVGHYLASEFKKIIKTGCQLVLVVGGGNMVRGAEVAGHGIKRVTADQMGMLSCLINALALTDVFESDDVKTRCLSNIFAPQVAESYSFRLAEKHLAKGRAVIVAGSIGRPYFTSDTGAVNLALELSCDVVLKATKVDGVYDKDPNKFSGAKLLKKISYQESLSNEAIKVMDKAALGLAMEHNMPVIVFDPMQKDNILKVATGKPVGSYIS